MIKSSHVSLQEPTSLIRSIDCIAHTIKLIIDNYFMGFVSLLYGFLTWEREKKKIPIAKPSVNLACVCIFAQSLIRYS